jgi:cytochrome c oxidase subunit 3
LFWFLFREVWFFFGIFWSFFHVRISPLTRRRGTWPFLGLEPIPPFQVPLLNTLILLMRGATATLAHHEVLKRDKSWWLQGSAFLGVYFLFLQGWEYCFSCFSISSGVFGRVFFMGTGFHGLHVCLGLRILLVSH